MEDTHVHALDYVSVVRRRRWWLAVPAVLSLFVGLALVRYLPKEYRSGATLAVTAPSVSPNLVTQTAFGNPERLRALSQLLLSEPILSRVVREEQLGTAASLDQEIAALRRSIGVGVPAPVASTSEPRRLDAFVVSYSDRDPARAQRIANRLATVFVDESSRTRTQSAETTSAFIAAQVRASQARLLELEEQLRQAKEAHMGELPEQLQANLQTLASMRQQSEANAVALRSERDRLDLVERQLDELRRGVPSTMIVTSDGSAPESRLLVLQRELAIARMSYTDKHPEVIRIQEELAAARQAASETQTDAERLAHLELDPGYRRLLAERQAATLRVRDSERTSADHRRQIALYQARVDAAPRVEQQLSSVQREYDLERQQYAGLSGKLHASSISESVERERSGEQFSVLYPANYPDEPIKPIPMRVMLMSILGGICLGGALAFGREYFDRSVHDVRQLKDEFDVPVLGEVTRIQPV